MESKSKSLYKNIKADYFFKNIFDYINTKIKLKILKHNKSIQKKINININNYKEFSEINSSIEIEIIPPENVEGKFINIENKDEEKYYHIYFNNSKTETKKKYNIKRKDKITKINIIIAPEIKSLKQLFYYCNCIKTLSFKKCFRTDIINMYRTFEGCTSLTEINLANLKTDNVTDMCGLFCNDYVLKIIDIPNFNTNKVTDMSCMFLRCKAIKKINYSSNFKINNEANIDYMFHECAEQFKSSMKNVFNVYFNRLKKQIKKKHNH